MLVICWSVQVGGLVNFVYSGQLCFRHWQVLSPLFSPICFEHSQPSGADASVRSLQYALLLTPHVADEVDVPCMAPPIQGYQDKGGRPSGSCERMEARAETPPKPPSMCAECRMALLTAKLAEACLVRGLHEAVEAFLSPRLGLLRPACCYQVRPARKNLACS